MRPTKELFLGHLLKKNLRTCQGKSKYGRKTCADKVINVVQLLIQ